MKQGVRLHGNQKRKWKRLPYACAAMALGVVLPFAQVFAQGTEGGGLATNVDATCENLIVLDFITDAAGNSLGMGSAVTTQYLPWGVVVSAQTADGQPVRAVVAELPSSSGPVNVLQPVGGGGGTIQFTFNNLVSVEAVELAGITQDRARVMVFDQNSGKPAEIPLTAATPQALRSVVLSELDAAVQLLVELPAGGGVSKVALCPSSMPKLVPRHSPPQLSLELAVDQIELTSGEIANIVMTVKNSAESVGYDLTVVQDLPPGLVFADDGANSRTWEIGAIGGRGSFTIPYAVRAETSAADTDAITHAVAMVSNGIGADGVASASVRFGLRSGRVLGSETQPQPTPAPSPVTQPPAQPTTPSEAPPAPALPPAPAPLPRATPSIEPVGGPYEPAVSPTPEPTVSASPIEERVSTTSATEYTVEPLVLATTALATSTATTTGAFGGSCTSWIWLLTIVNAVLIGVLARRESRTKSPDGQGQSRWVIAMLLVAVPLIIWYPACGLNWWLILTAIGTGVMVAITGGGKAPPTGSHAPIPPPLPPPGEPPR